MSPSTSAKTTPVGNAKVFIVLVCTIYSVVAMSSVNFRITPPVGRTYNTYNCARISPNIVVCSMINSVNASVGTLLVGLLLSIISFSKSFTVFYFLRVCGDSFSRGCLTWGDSIIWFVRSCISFSCCMSCSKAISWSTMISLTITFLVASFCEAAYCPWRVFSAKWVSRCWSSFFCCCTDIPSSTALFTVHHSRGHVAKTS